MKEAGKTLLREAPKTTRLVLKTVPGVPGHINSGVELFTAKDKGRAIAGLAGGTAGAALGGWLGPAGAVAGSALGSRAGELLYNDRDDIAAWMAARRAELARSLDAADDAVRARYRHGR